MGGKQVAVIRAVLFLFAAMAVFGAVPQKAKADGNIVYQGIPLNTLDCVYSSVQTCTNYGPATITVTISFSGSISSSFSGILTNDPNNQTGAVIFKGGNISAGGLTIPLTFRDITIPDVQNTSSIAVDIVNGEITAWNIQSYAYNCGIDNVDGSIIATANGEGGGLGESFANYITCPNPPAVYEVISGASLFNASLGSWTIVSTGGTPPTAANETAATPENVAVTLDLTAGASGSPTSAALVGTPVGGTVSGFPGTTVTFTPTAGFAGAGSFQFTLSNGNGASNTATATITVTAPPVAVNQQLSTKANTPLTIDLAAGSSGTPTSAAIVGTPVGGTVSIAGTTATFTPKAGFSGAASFQFTLANASGTSNTATASITVSSPGPVAVSEAASTGAGTPVTINLSAGATGNPAWLAGASTSSIRCESIARQSRSGGRK